AAMLGLAAISTSVVAAPSRLNDVQFIAANRCLGLMTSKALASPEADALAKFLKAQANARDPYIADEADQARQDAQAAAGHAGGERKARLPAERDGVCQDSLPSPDTARGGAGPQPSIR